MSLNAAQKYLTKWLIRYDDEYFGYLFYDIENLASSLANEIFQQNRSVSVYGVKGIGKTTLMQGILWEGLKNSPRNLKFLPVNVSVTGSSSVTTEAQLQELFYKSVLEGLLLASDIKNRHEKIKGIIRNYAPWISSATLAAISLVYAPATIAAAAIGDIIKQLLTTLGFDKKEMLLVNSGVNYNFAVNFIIENLKNKNIVVIFSIDELDKVTNDTLLTNFFEGNQGWFQGKQSIISLSYTYGDAIKNELLKSVSRFTSIQKLEGIKTLTQFKKILELRLLLGISEVEPYEYNAKQFASNIFSNDVPERIMNQFTPNLYMMLEEAFKGIKQAKQKGLELVTEEELPSSANRIQKPSELELSCLNIIVLSPIRSSDLATRLGKSRPIISRCLKALYAKGLVNKNKNGRLVSYFITQLGETALRINSVDTNN